MKVVPFVALALASFNAESAPLGEMPYREAASAAAAQVQEPSLVKWGQGALAPLFEKGFQALVETCMRLASEVEPNSVRVVVILSRDSVSVSIDPEGSAPISECVAQELQKWHWPTPPRVVYLPVDLNSQPPDPAEAERAAEQIINDLAPSNKSLERTRDR